MALYQSNGRKGMTLNGFILLSASAILLSACTTTQVTSMNNLQPRSVSPYATDIRAVSPGLERFTSETVEADLWKRGDLSPRDRSVVTLAAQIARNQQSELPDQIALALQNGVKPAEVSEIITHLAFYSGMGNAMGAVHAAKSVFAQRGIDASQLASAQGGLLPLDEKSEAERAARVESNFGSVAPGVVEITTNILFRDLWLRPGLNPRDRGLVTISALIAVGQVVQVPVHLNKAMDNGLTRAQVAEALTQLAFYAGWPNVFSAMPVVKEVFAKRPG